MKMYILCTITGTWKPRLLAKAWKGTKSDHQPALASGPPPPPPIPLLTCTLGECVTRLKTGS